MGPNFATLTPQFAEPRATPTSDVPVFPSLNSVFSTLGRIRRHAADLVPIDDLFKQFRQRYIENYPQLALAPSPAEHQEDALDRPLEAQNPLPIMATWI